MHVCFCASMRARRNACACMCTPALVCPFCMCVWGRGRRQRACSRVTKHTMMCADGKCGRTVRARSGSVEQAGTGHQPVCAPGLVFCSGPCPSVQSAPCLPGRLLIPSPPPPAPSSPTRPPPGWPAGPLARPVPADHEPGRAAGEAVGGQEETAGRGAPGRVPRYRAPTSRPQWQAPCQGGCFTNGPDQCRVIALCKDVGGRQSLPCAGFLKGMIITIHP